MVTSAPASLAKDSFVAMTRNLTLYSISAVSPSTSVTQSVQFSPSRYCISSPAPASIVLVDTEYAGSTGASGFGMVFSVQSEADWVSVAETRT